MIRRISSRPLLVALPLVVLGAWQLGGGLYIPAKAVLAQHLLDDAWEDTLDRGDEVRPWPWADTWPVARITVPRIGVEHVVLAGASGSSLAFGPGHVDGTPRPNEPGNCVIGGHRDTHFAFLQHLHIGDEVALQAADGLERTYRVVGTRVVDHEDAGIELATTSPHVTLVTCYPFDAVAPGGPLRYVVTAEMVG